MIRDDLYESQRRACASWEGNSIEVLMDMQTEEHVFAKIDERFIET